MKLMFRGIVVLVWLGAVSAFAQTAQMTGTISDQTGASVPNTTVTVTNVNTGVARSSITNASGNYLVTALLPGVRSGILRGFPDFLKSDEFGVGHGHALGLQ